jgi:hypothetical protein
MIILKPLWVLLTAKHVRAFYFLLGQGGKSGGTPMKETPFAATSIAAIRSVFG